MWMSRNERFRRLKRTAILEFMRQWPLFKERWKTILFGAAFQYVHAIFTQLAHRMARPASEPLHDLGFDLLPELGQQNEWMSELIFSSMLTSFLVWTFSPFWQESGKRFYTAVLYARVLMVLVICQSLRILSFTVTALPSPNYHCRTPRETAIAPWPKHWWGHIVVNLSKQATHGCGDLIFSSHTTFALVGVMSYQEYGTINLVKGVIWTGAFILSILIVASRKHYTVDVLIAWYVVPLVFYSSHRRWTTKRSLKDEWPHRPLPEEQPPELENVVILTNAEAPVPKQVAKQSPLLSSIQMSTQRANSANLKDLNGKDKPSSEGYVENASGSLWGNAEAGRNSSPNNTSFMRPRSTNTLSEIIPNWNEDESTGLMTNRQTTQQSQQSSCRIV